MDSSRNEGVRGQSHTAHGGVVGLNDWSATGSEPWPSDGVGVYGQAAAFGTSGIYGSNSSGTGVSGRGLIGVNAEGDGVAGVVCRGTDYGIWAFANSSGALAGNFEGNVSIKGSGSPFTFALGVGGNVYIEGTLSVTGPIQKFGGGFRIDHPTDPANQYLTHSFVESPDRKNVYDGVAVLDAKGEAAVKMPAWFDALNGDFRYQLTAIDPPGPNLYIARSVAGNLFKIAGGKPKMKVSWQVTGIRKDRWAKKNRIVVEERKSSKDRGRYLDPALYGQPKEKGLHALQRPDMAQLMKKARRVMKARKATSVPLPTKSPLSANVRKRK